MSNEEIRLRPPDAVVVDLWLLRQHQGDAGTCYVQVSADGGGYIIRDSVAACFTAREGPNDAMRRLLEPSLGLKERIIEFLERGAVGHIISRWVNVSVFDKACELLRATVEHLPDGTE